MGIDELYLSVTELSRLIAAKELSPVELTRAYLARADEIDRVPFELPADPSIDTGGRLASIITLAREEALSAARAAENEILGGHIRGPLHGIPYGVKDLLDTKGVRTTWGSRIFMDRVPDRDATVNARLREAGAIMMAKMSLAEFAGGQHQYRPQSMEGGSIHLRILERHRRRHGRRPHRFRDRNRDRWIDRPPLSDMRRHRHATHLRPGEPTRLHAPFVVPRQDRPHRAIGGGLRTGARSHRRARSERSFHLRSAVPLSRAGRSVGRPKGGDPSGGARRGAHPGEPGGVRPGARRVPRVGRDSGRCKAPHRPYGDVFSNITAVEGGAIFRPLFEDGRIDGMFRYNWSRRASWLAGTMSPAADYLAAQRIRQVIVNDADELMRPYAAVIAPTSANGAGPRDDVVQPPIPPPPRERSGPGIPRLNTMDRGQLADQRASAATELSGGDRPPEPAYFVTGWAGGRARS